MSQNSVRQTSTKSWIDVAVNYSTFLAEAHSSLEILIINDSPPSFQHSVHYFNTNDLSLDVTTVAETKLGKITGINYGIQILIRRTVGDIHIIWRRLAFPIIQKNGKPENKLSYFLPPTQLPARILLISTGTPVIAQTQSYQRTRKSPGRVSVPLPNPSISNNSGACIGRKVSPFSFVYETVTWWSA